MRLLDLLSGLAYTAHGDLNVTVNAVHDDSRRIAEGDVFVAVVGRTSDGRAFAQTAVTAGARAVVANQRLELPAHVVQVIVDDPSRVLGELVMRSLGRPADDMTLVGITGTNGKTTCTFVLEAMLRAAGHVPGIIGTVTYRWPGASMDAPYTTPTARVLGETLAKMKAAGVTHVIMEVTSAALAMHRVSGLRFSVCAFTNLTQDHLDLHQSMEAYEEAKRLLFTRYLADGGTCAVNIDDPAGERMVADVAARVLRVSTSNAGDIAVQRGTFGVTGIDADLITPRGLLAVTARPLLGAYNLANVALCVAIGEALGLPQAAMAKGLAELPGVPGRVERVANSAGLDIVVDYAHTPDALRNVLSALRPLTRGRLLCVFGCGGDRDPSKRPLMGAAVAELADLALVTSDNPRTENPRSIIDMILPAVPSPFFVHVDRRVAIRAAIAEAVPGDMVLIAGKGHEDYQIIGTTKTHFDDREEAVAAVAQRPSWTAEAIATVCGGTLHGDTSVVSATTATATRIGIDSRGVAQGDAYVAIRGAVHDGHAFYHAAVQAGARVLVVANDKAADIRDALRTATADAPASSSVAVVAVPDTRIALGALAKAHRNQFAGKVVAVTGSSGKTTTKELIRAALTAHDATWAAAGSNNNETGLPLTLLGMRAHHTYAVCEMGMRGLGQIAELTELARPDVAVVVNAGTAHIELLGSTDAIAQAKGEIWQGLAPGGVAVRPADDARLAHWAKQHAPHARTLTFGESDAADVRLVRYAPNAAGYLELSVVACGQPVELPLHVLGKHAALDACAAIAACLGAGAPLGDVVRGLSSARPPALRGELRTIANRHVLVDCYNANPDSMAASLTMAAEYARGHRLVAVLGDMLELGEHAAAAHMAIAEQCATLGAYVIALGTHAGLLTSRGGAVAADPGDAAQKALAQTQQGDWIVVKGSRGMRLERVVQALAH